MFCPEALKLPAIQTKNIKKKGVVLCCLIKLVYYLRRVRHGVAELYAEYFYTYEVSMSLGGSGIDEKLRGL